MKNLLTIAAAVLAALVLGYVLGRELPGESGPAGTAGEGERKILYWQAPMDPNFRRDGPGKSPMGMDLVPVYADDAGETDPALVVIDPTVVSNLGVRTALAERGPLSRRIDTVGYVNFDENTVQHIHTRVDGWIEKLSIQATGDAVERGQVLFELYSPTLVNAQEEYLAAMNSRNSGLRDASRQRLAALGVPAAEIERLDRERTVRQRLRVFAESDGVVSHLGVREGIYVKPETEVMSFASLERVWVIVEVFERQSAWVAPGQHAEVELDYRPGERWHGTVDYVYPELDPNTRTLKVRLRFDNPETALRPNMYAKVTIHAAPTAPVVHVPREALIRGGVADRVVVALGDGRFRSQIVEAGIEAGDRVEIRSGLSPADRVVTSGQFLIDSESNIETALERMQPQHRHAPASDDAARTDADAHDAMDHSQHRMEPNGRDAPATAGESDTDDHGTMDHSQHRMQPDGQDAAAEPDDADESAKDDHDAMDHSQHRMEPAQ